MVLPFSSSGANCPEIGGGGGNCLDIGVGEIVWGDLSEGRIVRIPFENTTLHRPGKTWIMVNTGGFKASERP